MTRLRVAVAGLGAIGREHLFVYQRHDLADVVAVVDPRPVALPGLEGVERHDSVRELLESGRAFDAVSLCTPDDLHFDDAAALIRAGKHLLLEKPIAVDVAEATELVGLAEASPSVSMPGHTLRFEPRYHHAHKLYRGGALGELVHGYLRRNNRAEVAARAGGRVPVSWFLGIHDVDALLWITGLGVDAVQAMETTARDASGRRATAVVANLRLGNGAVVQMESAWGLRDDSPTELDAALRLVTTGGEISIDGGLRGMTVVSGRLSLPMVDGHPLYGRPAGPLAMEIDAFVHSAIDGREPPVTMAQALEAVRVLAAVDRAVESGGLVTIPRE